MSTISRQECHELAALARLSLTDEEADRFAGELSPILDYLEQLQAVDTRGIPEHLPPSRPGSGLREDVAAPPLPRALVLAGVPAVRDDHVMVPKFKDD